MEADNMFEELGYEFSNNGTQICYFNDEKYEYVWFYLDNKTIEVGFDISINLFKAMQQKVLELGW